MDAKQQEMVSAGAVEVYDDFTAVREGDPDPAKWATGQMVVDGNVVWTWRDKNLQVRTGGGQCELSIPVFSTSHDEVGIFDNPKILFCSTKHWAHGGRRIRFASTLAAQFSGDMADYRDGFAGFHVLDFASGTVMDVIASGERLWAIAERLPIPGLVSPVEPFIEITDLGVASAPLREHAIAVEFDPLQARAYWSVDGEVRYEREMRTGPLSFFIALGLLTLWPQVDGKSVSNKGQGGAGRWGACRVSYL